MMSLWQFTALAFLALLLVKAEEISASDWLKRANAALTSYDYAGALEAFDHAVELDPQSYLTYFRRSTAHQALGRTKSALQDLETTVKYNPTFGKAYLQRARIELREGDFDLAQKTLKNMEKHKAKSLEKDKDQANDLYEDIKRADSLQKRLEIAHSRSADECVKLADELLKLAPNSITAY